MPEKITKPRAGSTLDDIATAVSAASGAYYRLVLLVGPPGSGKTDALRAAVAREGWATLNLSLELAKRLKDISIRSRPRKVTECAEEAVSATGADVVAVDHIELAFEPALQQDPLRLLQQLSRSRTIVAAWPGTYDGQQLTYAEPSHREYRRYSKPDAQILLLHGAHAKLEPERNVRT